MILRVDVFSDIIEQPKDGILLIELEFSVSSFHNANAVFYNDFGEGKIDGHLRVVSEDVEEFFVVIEQLLLGGRQVGKPDFIEGSFNEGFLLLRGCFRRVVLNQIVEHWILG